MDRRTFLGTMTAATIFADRLARAASDDRKLAHIAVQLYTVRGPMKKDFEGTLAKVASIGYREVEFAGLFNHTPQQVKSILDRDGLAAISSHVDYNVLETDWDKTLEGAKTMGQSFIGCPWIDEKMRTPDGIKKVVDTFNRAGEKSKNMGIQFAFHNHDYEFKTVGDKLLYDTLLDQTDPNFVKMEMDLFWIIVAGKDPVDYFNRYPGRFPLVHVKDRTKDGKMTEVGSGAIDWKRIFAESDKAGIQHYIVEHDEPKAPLASIKSSYTYLESLRY
ncbi:MAG TPA: sugar phosphate isomerase/epimerase [Terriglobales bacterium]|nr:sugar phosphate isomerase/epimerase [Terriglobales bacterium]